MIQEKQDSTFIFHTEPKKGRRIKVLFVFEGFILLCLGINYVPKLFELELRQDFIAILLFTAIEILTIFGGIRLVIKVFDQEKIIVSPETFKIKIRKWLRTRTKEYLLDEITDISYAGYTTKTDHPLKGQSYDYLGFETREMEITKLHDDGNLRLTQGNKTIVFGQNINTWDAQQISNVLSSLTDGRLVIQNLPEEIPEEVYMSSADMQMK